MITGFSGIVIIFSENLSFNFSSQLLGSAAVVLSAVLQSTVVIAVKKYGRHIHHTSLNYIPMIIGVLCFFLFSYFMEDWRLIHPTVKGSLAILYLGVFGSVIAFTSYYWLLKKISVLALSLVAFITPVVAIISGWLFLNEQLSAREISGSVVVLFGLVINNLNLLKPAISQYWKRNIEKHHQN
jgi:drug/metabolite transporter (DMT)-like permease